MTDEGIVPPGGGHLLTARGSVMAFKAVAAQTGGGTGPVRLLVLHAPAMDAYFEELHRLWAGGQPPATEDERALMARYGMEPA